MTMKMQSIQEFLRDDTGQDLIEYALLAGLIALAAISAIRGLATKIATSFNSIGSQVTSAT